MAMNKAIPAVFLDRDGVLVVDTGRPLARAADIVLLPGVPTALAQLHAAGFRLVAITNQSVVARGTLTEPELVELHHAIDRRILDAGGPALDAWYYCPHHPKATLPAYRVDCDCRKPRPGLLRRAAADLGLSLADSLMVGDRLTDVAAGRNAGCRTAWVHTGRHFDPQIETLDPVDPGLLPDVIASGLPEVVNLLLQHPR